MRGVWKRLHTVLLTELRRRGDMDLARAVVDTASLRALRGGKAGPNPTDRRKAGSKHHVLTDAHGVLLVATLTPANRNDMTELLPLVDAMPAIGGQPGPPCRKPGAIYGDRGYDSPRHRADVEQRGITPVLARRYRGPLERLGPHAMGGRADARLALSLSPFERAL
jgi:transposase